MRNLNQLLRLAEPVTDHELLDQLPRDGAAFAELVRRHGSAVLGICRRVLGHEQDAEDAFQATFLVLARKALSIRREESLGAWLFGVGRHIALRLRDKERRRRRHEAAAGRPETTKPGPNEELTALDEEIERLPAKYRTPLVACLLAGRTQEEAARELGWSLNTLKRRLGRARELLRARLTARGMSAGVLVSSGVTVVPQALAEATGRLVIGFLNGDRGSGPAILAEGVLAMMTRAKLIKTGVLVLLLGGVVGLWQAVPGMPTAEGRSEPKTNPKADTKANPKSDTKADPKRANDLIRPGNLLLFRATNVFETHPLDGLYVVESGGTVVLGPTYGGRIKIDGLTVEQAEEAIQKQIRNFATRAVVIISRVPDEPVEKLERRVQLLEQEVLELRAAIRELQKGREK